jgi:hypothetical protein
MVDRAIHVGMVRAAITCERRPQCATVLDKRRAVSFVLVTGAGRRIPMVTCAECFDVHIKTIPADLPGVTVTLGGVLDGRGLFT